MNIFGNRPLCFICFVYMAMSVVSYLVNATVKLIIAAAAVAAILIYIVIFRRGKITKRRLATLCTLTVIGLLSVAMSFGYFDIYYRNFVSLTDKPCEATVLITKSYDYNENYSAYKAEMYSVDGKNYRGKVLIECEYSTGIQPGTVISIGATAKSLENDEHRRYIGDGYILALVSENQDEIRVIERNKITPHVFFGKLNAFLCARQNRIIGGEEGKLASALLFADRDGLSDKTNLDFSRVGISHILALSGLHMSIIALFFGFIMKKLFVPKAARNIILTVLLVLYLALTGFSTSAVRSVLMVYFVYIAYFFENHSDTRTALFIAGTLILAFSPFTVASEGFWMSFLATSGIVIVTPYIPGLFRTKKHKSVFFRILRTVITSLIITPTANVFVIFPTWLFTGEMSLEAPLANLIVAPAVTVMMGASMLCMAFYLTPLSTVFAFAASEIGKFILFIADRISDLRNISVSLKYGFTGVIICLFSAVAVVLLIVNLRKKRSILLAPAVAVVAFAICLISYRSALSEVTDIIYLNIKNNEIIIIAENGKATVCDISDGYYSRFREAAVAVEDNCITEVESLVLTHYHSSQLSGTERFYENIKVREIMLPEPDDGDEYKIMLALIDIAENAGVKAVIYNKEESIIPTGKTELNVMSAAKLKRSEHPCVALTVRRGDDSLLYSAASYFEADNSGIIRDAAEKADYVIVGSHNPKPKAKVSWQASDENREVVVGNDEILSMTDVSCDTLLCGAEIYNIHLSASKD